MGYCYTFLWALTPFLELRASIPLGYLKFGLTIYEAVAVSVFGGILAAALLIWILPIVVKFFDQHIPLFHRILQKIFVYTHAKHSHKIEIMGEIALIILVAIPLPGSGSWTGALLAYLFGLPKKIALILIGIGVLLSGIIVALLTLFGHGVWNFINGGV